MRANTLSPDLRTAAPGFAATFALIMSTLRTACIDFLPPLRFLALIDPILARIARLTRRFERLMALLAAGKLPRISRSGRGGTSKPLHVPTGRAWLSRALGNTTHAAALADLLAQPGMADLIAAAPEHANRILNPLRRMLGLAPFEPRPPPKRPRRPRPEPIAWPTAQPAPATPPPQPPDPPPWRRFSMKIFER